MWFEYIIVISGASNQLSKTVVVTSSGYKIDSIDLFYNDKHIIVFWCDHKNHGIQTLSIKLGSNGKLTHSSETKIILKKLLKPQDISVDWLGNKIYVTDSNKIVVSTFDGKQFYVLISDELYYPRDIVVAPVQGQLFWIDWGPFSRIETSFMDGTRRKILVSDGIVWPTSLTLDYPAQRLYWSDPKLQQIESVSFDGKSRHVVKFFSRDQRPFKLEVFEDNLFINTYDTHNILKMNKFGQGNITVLAQGLPRLSDLVIVHEQKQDRKQPNRCKEFCHSSEFCLLNPTEAKCVCAEGYIKDNFVSIKILWIFNLFILGDHLYYNSIVLSLSTKILVFGILGCHWLLFELGVLPARVVGIFKSSTAFDCLQARRK